jgi:hypothetical protein
MTDEAAIKRKVDEMVVRADAGGHQLADRRPCVTGQGETGI